MKTILIVWLAVAIYKLVANVTNYLKCRHYLALYTKYLDDQKWEFLQSKQQITRLFRNAGVVDSYVAHVEPVGYGQLQTDQLSVFSNIASTRVDVVGIVSGKFHEALGVYRGRIFETLSPLYWIDLIIFLPKNIFVYLGAQPEGVMAKVAQIAYWCFAGAFALFQEEIKALLLAKLHP